MRKFILFLLFLVCEFAFAQVQVGTVWVSQKPGFWNDSTVWRSNQIPQISEGDTLILSHPVVLQSNLILPQNTHTHIDSNGGLCGHFTIVLQSNTSMLIDGILEADSMFLFGSRVETTAGSRVTLYRHASITGTGSLWVNRGTTIAGPWFDCKLPEFAFALSVASPLENHIRVFPNPAKDKLVIKSQKPVTFTLYDKLGRLLISKNLDQPQTEIQLPGLKSGLFVYTISDESGSGKPMLLQVE